jgi:hypothetical protein
MKYAYQRTGAPILNWTSGPPQQSRAADSVALGSLGGGTTLDYPTLVLPAPGAPEPVGITRPTPASLSGCSCSGSCGCGSGMGGMLEAIPGGIVTVGIAAFAAWWMLRKRR